MKETFNWNSISCFRVSILLNKAFIALGMSPVSHPSLRLEPMVYVFPDPVCTTLKTHFFQIRTHHLATSIAT